VVDARAGILPGPDTDSIGFAERYDGCHFSTEGMEHAARLWLDAIRIGGAHTGSNGPDAPRSVAAR
jgi:hypothetical protein